MATDTPKKAIPNDRLRNERKKRNWTQSDVAGELYSRCSEEELEEHGVIDGNMVSKWERGLHIPGPFWRRKLGDLFGLDVEALGFIDQVETADALQETPLTSLVKNINLDGYQPIQLYVPNGIPLHVTVHVHQQGPLHAMPSFQKDVILEEGNITRPEQESADGIGDAVNRRDFLREAVALLASKRLLNLRQLGSLLHYEEILAICTTYIPICWRLYFDGHLAEVQEVLLPDYLPLLSLLVQESFYQKRASDLASKAAQLAALIEKHHQNSGNALMYARQGEKSGQLAGDPNLQIASLIQQGNIHFDLKQPWRELGAYQKAYQVYQKSKQHSEISPLLLGRVYIGLAKAYSKFKESYKQEALRFLGMAHEVYPERPEQDFAFSYSCHSRFTLINHTGLTYLNLDQPRSAQRVFESASVPTALVPRRVELLIRTASVSFALGDLKQSCDAVGLAVTSAQALGSHLRYNEAFDIYTQLLDRWPNEEQVKTLAKYFKH